MVMVAWSQGIPTLLGALIGATAAIGTQIWQARRQRNLGLQAHLEEAVASALGTIDQVGVSSALNSALSLQLHHRAVVVRAWAVRSKKPGFAKEMDRVLGLIMRDATSETLVAAAAELSISCTTWLTDDNTFERK